MSQEAPASTADRGRRPSVWPIGAWLMTAVSAAVLALGVSRHVLAPTLVLDLVSFWPGLVVAILAAAALWPFRLRGPARLAAVLPLLLLSWAWGVVALHFGEWELLPSADADLRGPPATGIEQAELSLEVGGDLRVSPGEGLLYEAIPQRAAGNAGVPQAFERIEEGTAVVRIDERAPGRWFANAGWRVALATSPLWSLDFRSDHVEADLRSFELAGLGVAGDGQVQLPEVDRQVGIVLKGRLALTVPARSGVELLGEASVPSGWEVTETGWRTPGGPTGYVITVADGSKVTVAEH